MANEQSGLLIAALVAIVAVVGLVILFKGGATGNSICPPNQEMQMVMNPDGQNYYQCMSRLTDVDIVGHYEPMVNYGERGSSFQTEYQKKQRDREILQGTWDY